MKRYVIVGDSLGSFLGLAAPTIPVFGSHQYMGVASVYTFVGKEMAERFIDDFLVQFCEDAFEVKEVECDREQLYFGSAIKQGLGDTIKTSWLTAPAYSEVMQ